MLLKLLYDNWPIQRYDSLTFNMITTVCILKLFESEKKVLGAGLFEYESFNSTIQKELKSESSNLLFRI